MSETNLIDGTSLKRFFGELKRLHEEGESAKGVYMKECQKRNDRRKAILEAANNAGVPRRELKLVFKRFILEQKIEAIEDDLDDATVYESMIEAFGESGDLPMFAAALDRAKPSAGASKAAKQRKAKADAVDSLVDDDDDIRPPHLIEAERQRLAEEAAAAANAQALQDGIKTLN
jgi:hypothetical protein